MNSTITVLGAGYVGLTTAALFSNAGHTVYLVDTNKHRLGTVKLGRSFFYEAGIDPIIAEGINLGTLIPTDSYAESVPNSEFVFSCVGTPDNPDGSSNLNYVFSAATETLKYAKSGTVYIQKSTVPVGTGQQIIDLFAAKDNGLPYVSNPEFLREGTAVSDTLWFDRVVVGGDDTAAVDQVTGLYKQLEDHRDEIAKRARLEPVSALNEYIATSRTSAELIKVTSNAFLALKISFANSIAKLADATGANIKEVMDAVGADRRIGRSFLNAGRGYGGGCFPKDVSGLISSGLEFGVDLEIMQAAQAVNESMPGYVVEKLRIALDDDLNGKRIAVLGLAFKAGTSDTRRSPGVEIANILTHHGAVVTAYDPQANDEAKEDLRKSITVHGSQSEAIENTEAIIVATDWPEFSNLPASTPESTVIIDAVNMLEHPRAIGIGK